MRVMLIALLAAGTAMPAQAQMTATQGGAAVRTGGNWGGGQWRGGQVTGGVQRQSQWQGQRQSQAGSWGGQRQSQWQAQRQSQGQWTGGRQGGGLITGRDPATWGPGNQPGPRNGGNPGTWSPGPRPGMQVGGDPRTWGPPLPNQNGGRGSWHGGTWNGGGSWNGGGNWNGGNWGSGGRWGGQIDGRWHAGNRAPGGWGAYRRPHRGWAMPGYWRSPNWAINDWQFFGLQAPPVGYSWSRYYDDAVLLDGNGYVYDTVGGVDWQRYDQAYATGYGYPSQGYANAPDGVDGRCYPRRKGSGVGGAIVGGAIGAGIGVATGGLGTALIAGGVGALAGQAIDRESRGSQVVCDDGYVGYPGDYAPGAGYDYAPGGPGVVYAPPQPVIQPVYGYQDYAWAPGATATATVEFAPVVTTTTTTTVTEEWVTDRHVTRRKVKPRTKVICRC